MMTFVPHSTKDANVIRKKKRNDWHQTIITTYFQSETTHEVVDCIDLTDSSDEQDTEDETEDFTEKPKLTSVDPDYSDNFSNPIPGDLVITSLRTYRHNF